MLFKLKRLRKDNTLVYRLLTFTRDILLPFVGAFFIEMKKSLAHLKHVFNEKGEGGVHVCTLYAFVTHACAHRTLLSRRVCQGMCIGH